MSIEVDTNWAMEWVPSDCWSDYQVVIGVGAK